MPHSTHRPHLMGGARIIPSGCFEAGSFASFTLVYTAGYFGVDETGAIKVAFRFATDMTPPQFGEPTAPGFTTARTNRAVSLACTYDPVGTIRPWDKTLLVRVTGGYLREGDQILLRFGDTAMGSPGMRLQTFCEDTFEFRVLVDAMASNDFVALPESPTIAIVPGTPARWNAVLPTMRRRGQPFRCGLKSEDRWGNPSDKADQRLLLYPSLPVAGLPRAVTFRPGRFATSLSDLTVDETGDLVIEVRAEDGTLLALTNTMRVVDAAERLPYWGDLHGQSEETVGTNPAGSYFAFGRDRAFLDLCAHQGNDFEVTDRFWAELNKLTAAFNQPGRYVTVPGYEWSGNTAVGGDRNVYFAHEGRPIRRSSRALLAERDARGTDCLTASRLFAALADEDAVVVAHVGGRYSDLSLAHEPSLERSVEVHSAWGTFEWLLDDAFRLGFRPGVVGNSDDHKGRPGASHPGASQFGAYGGLTCFLLRDLNREALFDCLRRRHHYATTGARMMLDVAVHFAPGAQVLEDGSASSAGRWSAGTRAMMGDIVRARDAAVTLSVEVLGTAAIERVELCNGSRVVDVVRPYGRDDLGQRIRVLWEGAASRGRGRQTTWDGRAEVRNNRIARVQAFNMWNPDRGIEAIGDGTLVWRSSTTGNFSGFDVWVEDEHAGTIEVDTPLVSARVPLNEIGLYDRVFEAGGLGRRLRVFRLPERNVHRGILFERRIDIEDGRDNPLYVRVTQEDGHRAWSSPVYVLRQLGDSGLGGPAGAPDAA